MARNRFRTKRKRLWRQQQHRCFYCIRYVVFGHATVDHLVPQSEGGDHSDGNLVMACQWCNKKRGVEDALEFKKKVNKMMAGGVPIGPVDYIDNAARRNKARKEHNKAVREEHERRQNGEEE